MAVTLVSNGRRYIGLAGDTRPTAADVPAGSEFTALDTGGRYVYDGSAWTLMPGADGYGYAVMLQEALITQTTGNGTYTATLPLPAGARIVDIGCDGIAQWNASTSASLVVGDAGAANGFFLATDLKATDLLTGEINNLEHPGGKAGAYIAAEQRVLYSTTARSVIAVVTQVGTGTAGITRIYVAYSVATATNAAKV